ASAADRWASSTGLSIRSPSAACMWAWMKACSSCGVLTSAGRVFSNSTMMASTWRHSRGSRSPRTGGGSGGRVRSGSGDAKLSSSVTAALKSSWTAFTAAIRRVTPNPVQAPISSSTTSTSHAHQRPNHGRAGLAGAPTGPLGGTPGVLVGATGPMAVVVAAYGCGPAGYGGDAAPAAYVCDAAYGGAVSARYGCVPASGVAGDPGSAPVGAPGPAGAVDPVSLEEVGADDVGAGEVGAGEPGAPLGDVCS